MRNLSPPRRLPEGLRALRAATRRGIVWMLFLLPPLLGWLAAQAGLGWELVSLLGTALALGGAMARRARFGTALLAGGAAVGCALLLAAGQSVLPPALATALPFAAMFLCAGLCDGRALGVALGLLAGAALLRMPPGEALPQVLALAAVAGAALAAQHVAVRHLSRRAEVLLPGRAPAAPVWTRPREGFALPSLLVQAERTPEGAVRLAVAGHAAGRLRVTVR